MRLNLAAILEFFKEPILPDPSRYRLYVDESGDPVYNLLDRPSHRYLSLLGVWFRESDDYVAFADALEAFKRDIFGPRPDKPVILHRDDIINRRGPFGILRENDTEKRFNDGVLRLISNARFRMICVILDKQTHLAKYTDPSIPTTTVWQLCWTDTADGSTSRMPEVT